jgi:NTE family protein
MCWVFMFRRVLKKAEELKTPVDIIYQMGFFKDAYMFRKNKDITDLFISPDLEGYEASSFGDVQQIIERGKQIARMPTCLK